MSQTADLFLPKYRATRLAETAGTTEDNLFRTAVIGAVLLEIVVFHEPAPVDAVIIFCLALGVLFGTLVFKTIGTLPLVSLVIFAVANLVSMYDPFDLTRAVWYVFVTLYLIGSWFFFVGVIGKYGLRFMDRLIVAYCVAGLVSALLGIGGYFHVLPYQNILLLQGRARGLFKDCNVYGPYFVPVALFTLTRLMNDDCRARHKLLAFFVFLSAVVAMLLCFSRACWLNCGVSLAVFYLLQFTRGNSQRRGRPNFGIGMTVLLAGGLAAFLLVNSSAVKEMLAVRVTDSGLQKYDRIRFATQDLAFDTAEEHPLGIGPGQAELVFGYATHSMYLRILSENGIIALLAILVFIGATAARSWSIIRSTENEWLREINIVVLACIAGHLANSLVIDTVHWRHIWFIYALPWANAHLSEIGGRRRIKQSPERKSGFLRGYSLAKV